MADYQAGVLPIKKYLQKRWNDLSERDIETWAQDIEREQTVKSQRESYGQYPFNDSDYYNESGVR